MRRHMIWSHEVKNARTIDVYNYIMRIDYYCWYANDRQNNSYELRLPGLKSNTKSWTLVYRTIFFIYK